LPTHPFTAPGLTTNELKKRRQLSRDGKPWAISLLLSDDCLLSEVGVNEKLPSAAQMNQFLLNLEARCEMIPKGNYIQMADALIREDCRTTAQIIITTIVGAVVVMAIIVSGILLAICNHDHGFRWRGGVGEFIFCGF
jgi:hypothetical protein